MKFYKRVKGLSRDALVYGVGDALGKLISIFTAPILTRIFTTSDYGVVSLIQVAVGLLVMLAGMNLNSGTYYFYYKYKSQSKKQIVLSTALIVYSLVALLASVLLWVFAPYTFFSYV